MMIMKKTSLLISIILIVSIMFYGCNNNSSENQNEINYNNLDTAAYNFDNYMLPIWENNYIINESVLLLLNEDGNFDDKSLLFDAEEIISVRNSALNIKYTEGNDYMLVNGKLRLNVTSAYAKVAYNEYYINYVQDWASLRCINGGYLYYSEGSYYHNHQIAVTYRHKGTFPQNIIPKAKGNILPKTTAKLSNKETLKISLFGDSNAEGCNSSGYINSSPYMPTYFEMLQTALRNKYNYDEIFIENSLSKGGEASNYAVQKISELINLQPDLVILQFGNNDAFFNTNETFQSNMQFVINELNRILPDTEIILVTGPVPNPEDDRSPARQLYTAVNDFADILQNMEKQGCAVADLASIYNFMFTRKQFGDISGNNINHLNDFTSRLLAQTLFKTLQK